MSKQKFGLGRGLGALLPSDSNEPEAKVPVVPTPETRDDGVSTGVLAHVEIARISPNPYQPRIDFDPEALEELAQSIRENGLIQPVTVRRLGDGYQLISGERRLRACQVAGITHVPAYIRQVDTVEEMIELALIENIQRETLNPIEIAQTYRRLMDDYQYTQDEISKKVGKNRASVSNFVRLLRLPKDIQESIQKGEFSFGHARALVNVSDAAAQLRIWKKSLREGLSVCRVEELVREAAQPPAPVAPKKKRTRSETPPAFDDVAARLRGAYGTKVSITADTNGSGVISFEFYNLDDFERILELLTPTA